MVKLREIELYDEKSVIDILTNNIAITVLRLHKKILLETNNMMIEADEIYIPEIVEEFKKEINEMAEEINE
jgi:hypothetical protein